MKARHLVLIFALLQVAIALLTDSGTFTHEESMWHYIGRNWFRFGMTPYEGGVDNKSPLIFAVFGLSDLLSGINFWFPRLMGTAVEAVGVFYLYKIALNISGENKKLATVATTVYGLTVLWPETGGKYVSFTETYAVALMIMAVYYYLSATQNKRFFVAGLLAGFAAGWRLSAAFSALAVSEHALFNKRKGLPSFIAGMAVSIVSLLVVAWMAGIEWRQLWQFMVSENVGQGSTTDHSFAWKRDSFLQLFASPAMWLFYPLIILWFLSKQRSSLLTIWLVCEFIGIVALGIYARPHLKALLPPLALISSFGIVQLMEHYHFSFNKVLVATWIIFFPKTIEPLLALKRMTIGESARQVADDCMPPYPRTSERKEKMVGLWIRDHTRAGDKVLVAGFGARVQLYAERLSPSVYFNVTQTPAAIERFKREVLLHKPAMIVVPLFADYAKYVRAELRQFIDSVATNGYEYRQCVAGYGVYVLSSSHRR